MHDLKLEKANKTKLRADCHGCRLITQGEIFAIPDPAVNPQHKMLAAICLAPLPESQHPTESNGNQAFGDQHLACCCSLLWFKVTSTEPQQAMPLAVDPLTTAVSMQVTSPLCILLNQSILQFLVCSHGLLAWPGICAAGLDIKYRNAEPVLYSVNAIVPMCR